ncbi:transmembrane protein [Cavenderia fasciculata]|uniref:ER membrane protein complex subunit 6 n=1 Tax=Cavenderia fasciculata TaxID=261658 RepID=F4QFQ6_CACFS|nr:uncharacterized protein DFA_12073 [Cavenderia fasciculata]EGG14303.1 transmembrane protein [Cavenderia fasciculata]|eukprot:XP_004351012.1 transmembrane protein [Cavenderia fasciculata]
MINPQQHQPQAPEAIIPEIYDSDYINLNLRSKNNCRILISSLGGCVAGLLGLTNLWGFVFFVFVHFLFCALYSISHKSLINYFVNPKTMWYEITSGMMSFVLFWTFFSNIL